MEFSNKDRTYLAYYLARLNNGTVRIGRAPPQFRWVLVAWCAIGLFVIGSLAVFS